jgi:hypothetical protein
MLHKVHGVEMQDMKKGRRVNVPESEFKEAGDGLKCVHST